MSERVSHCFEPVYNRESRILILGTMPSPASRSQGFYYSHPRNRFWSVLAEIFGETVPENPEERRKFALRHRIALWDVLAACDIDGASDASIRNPVVNDIGMILNAADIRAVFTTGAKAAQLYRKYCVPSGLPQCIALPSTSPANAGMSVSQLKAAYSVVTRYLA